MLTSATALDILHDLTRIVVRDDARDGDTFLVVDDDLATCVRDAATAPGGPALSVRTTWSLPETGCVFALALDTARVADAPALRFAARTGRLAFVAWPRTSDDAAATAIARRLGLVPLVAVVDERGVSLDHAAVRPDGQLHVAVQPALLRRDRVGAPPAAPVAASPSAQPERPAAVAAPTERVVSGDAWLGAARAYLALGLHGAARSAAARAGAVGDALAQRARQLADVDEALTAALATSQAPVLPVRVRVAQSNVVPVVQATAHSLEGVRFAQQLDDEVIGHGVDGIARTFVLVSMGATGTLLELSTAQGQLAVAVTAAVGPGRVVVCGGADGAAALTPVFALLDPRIRPVLYATAEAAAQAAMAIGGTELVVHATRAAVDDGSLERTVHTLRASAAAFVVVFSGFSGLFNDVDADVAAIVDACRRLGLGLQGAALMSDGKFGLAPLAEMPRAHLLVAC